MNLDATLAAIISKNSEILTVLTSFQTKVRQEPNNGTFIIKQARKLIKRLAKIFFWLKSLSRLVIKKFS